MPFPSCPCLSRVSTSSRAESRDFISPCCWRKLSLKLSEASISFATCVAGTSPAMTERVLFFRIARGFPGGENAQYLCQPRFLTQEDYESDPDAIRAALPEPLEPALGNIVFYEWMNMPGSSSFGDYE